MKMIVLDTNAWLYLYTINPLALKEIVSKFEKKQSWFWIPEQVYWEFGNHSKESREKAVKAVSEVSTKARVCIETAKNQVYSELLKLSDNGILKDETLISSVRDKFDVVRELVKTELNKIDKKYQEHVCMLSDESDVINRLIQNIYTDNPPYIYSEVQRLELYEEGEKRRKYHMPPGLTDFDKEDSNKNILFRRRYGDYLIWKDILRKSKEIISLSGEEKLEVIFVENEKKADWWKARGTMEMAPVLIEEFDDVSGGKANIIMLDFTEFLTEFGTEFGIEETTVDSIIEKQEYKERVFAEVQENLNKIIENSLSEYLVKSNYYKTLFINMGYSEVTLSDLSSFNVSVLDNNQISIHENDVGCCVAGNVTIKYSGVFLINKEGTGKEEVPLENVAFSKIAIQIVYDYLNGYESCHYNTGSILYSEYSLTNMQVKKQIVFVRDNYTCQRCGKRMADGTSLTLDHIIPRTAGGSDDISNLQTLCNLCNVKKGSAIYAGYTTCPDCGTPISSWNDGGNGFCTNCSSEH